MAGITLAIAEARLTAYLNAEAALLTGGLAEVDVFGKKIKKLDIGQIQTAIDYWAGKVDELTAQGTSTARKVRGGTIV